MRSGLNPWRLQEEWYMLAGVEVSLLKKSNAEHGKRVNATRIISLT